MVFRNLGNSGLKVSVYVPSSAILRAPEAVGKRGSVVEDGLHSRNRDADAPSSALPSTHTAFPTADGSLSVRPRSFRLQEGEFADLFPQLFLFSPPLHFFSLLSPGGTVKGDPVKVRVSLPYSEPKNARSYRLFPDQKEIIRTALDHGVNFFDNAEVYSNGESEIQMGRVFKELGVDRSRVRFFLQRRFLLSLPLPHTSFALPSSHSLIILAQFPC